MLLMVTQIFTETNGKTNLVDGQDLKMTSYGQFNKNAENNDFLQIT